MGALLLFYTQLCPAEEGSSFPSAHSSPPKNVFAIFCDGAFDARSRVADSAYVMSLNGSLVDGIGKRCPANSALVAEAFAIRDACHLI